MENEGITGLYFTMSVKLPLDDRIQYVVTNSVNGQKLGVKFGVPQGPILEPHIFVDICHF